jgi:hypothetical protein
VSYTSFIITFSKKTEAGAFRKIKKYAKSYKRGKHTRKKEPGILKPRECRWDKWDKRDSTSTSLI